MTDHLEPRDLSHHVPAPEPLSPAAQAVVDAWLTSENGERMLGDPACLAAALRAAADQEGIKPEPVGPMPDASPEQVEIALAVKRSQVRAHRAILAIAAELEGGVGSSSTHLEVGDG